MSNLKLITTESFENGVNEYGIPCDFWKDINEEYYITREQIGTALGYINPRIAIRNIHEKHKDRCDKFSTVYKVSTVEGDRTVERERIFYSRKGVMEICRWSRQPIADKFMDWVWDVIDGLITRGMQNNNIEVSKEMINTVNEISTSVKEIEREVSRRSKCSYHYSKWRAKVAQKVKILAFIHNLDTNDGIKKIYGRIYGDMRIYGKDINDYKEEYLNQFPDIDGIPSGIEIVEYFGELRDMFDNILDNWLISDLDLEKHNMNC